MSATALTTVTPPLAVAGAVAAAVAGFAYATFKPDCAIWGPVISRGPGGGNRIALTFDDGPTPGTTDRVLDALRECDGAVATFFVVGVNARKHPDLLKRIRDEGHLVANHSQRHSHYAIMRRNRYWEREVREADETIESILGVRPRLFRPPMGAKTWHTTHATRKFGHTLVTWSKRAMDGFATTSQRILQRMEHIGAGDIVLLHDGVEPFAPHADREATIAAIPSLLERIGAKGLTPVRLDELLGIDGYA